MTIYIHAINGEIILYPSTSADLVAEFPNVSFPLSPRPEDLAPFNRYPVATAPRPADTREERAIEGDPSLTETGWQQVWTTRPATEQEIAAWDAANQPAPDWSAFKAAMLSSPTVNAALVAAMPSAPSAVMALPAALMALATGGASADFRACWLMLRRLDLVPQDVLDEVTAAATDSHLPQELIGSLGGAS